MRRFYFATAILATFCALLLSTHFTLPSPTASAQLNSGESQEICAGTTIPNGWVKVNDYNNLFKCGNPTSHSVLNVWIIQRHDNRFRHDTMVVCNPVQGAPAPFPGPNWAVENTFNSIFDCGRPTTFSVQNMATIKCLNCPVAPTPTPTPVGPDYEGWLDAANCDVISGWVWNKREPNTPLRVDVIVNGSTFVQLTADQFRQDLKDTGRGDGRHMFKIPTPARLKNSRNNTVNVKVSGSQFFIANGNKTFNCANPIDDAHFFVKQHYIDFLGREADQGGLNFWADQITACGTDAGCIDHMRTQVSKAFFLSIEFQQTGYYVHRFYRAAFARMPTTGEFAADKGLVSAGVVVGSPGWESTLNFNKVSFANTFASRSNFTSFYNGLNNQQFVDQLIANTGAPFAADFRNDLINGLNGGAYSRAEALRRIVEYQPYIDKEFNPAFVMMQYFGYLRRHPSEPPDNAAMEGYFFWLDKLNTQGSQNEMVRAFLTSTEYRNRFGSDQPFPGSANNSTKASEADFSGSPYGYSYPTPPCDDWDGDGYCDPQYYCEDWDGDGIFDYCW
jgi:hypothetical protein